MEYTLTRKRTGRPRTLDSTVKHQWEIDKLNEKRAKARHWHEVNPAAQRIANMKKRAEKIGSPGTFTVEEWEAVVKFHQGRCAYCGLEASLLHMDHIHALCLWGTNNPLSHLSTNYIENIESVCSYCNNAKGDKPLIVFLAWLNGSR